MPRRGSAADKAKAMSPDGRTDESRHDPDRPVTGSLRRARLRSMIRLPRGYLVDMRCVYQHKCGDLRPSHPGRTSRARRVGRASGGRGIRTHDGCYPRAVFKPGRGTFPTNTHQLFSQVTGQVVETVRDPQKPLRARTTGTRRARPMCVKREPAAAWPSARSAKGSDRWCPGRGPPTRQQQLAEAATGSVSAPPWAVPQQTPPSGAWPASMSVWGLVPKVSESASTV